MPVLCQMQAYCRAPLLLGAGSGFSATANTPPRRCWLAQPYTRTAGLMPLFRGGGALPGRARMFHYDDSAAVAFSSYRGLFRCALFFDDFGVNDLVMALR